MNGFNGERVKHICELNHAVIKIRHTHERVDAFSTGVSEKTQGEYSATGCRSRNLISFLNRQMSNGRLKGYFKNLYSSELFQEFVRKSGF